MGNNVSKRSGFSKLTVFPGMGNQKSSQAKSKNKDGSKKMADYPIEFHTTNNKLQMTARSLELIYKVPSKVIMKSIGLLINT